jgi:hypothetical protein
MLEVCLRDEEPKLCRVTRNAGMERPSHTPRLERYDDRLVGKIRASKAATLAV